MKNLFLVMAALVLLAGLSTTAMALTWQTEPILGTAASDVTGDLVVITGPTPINPATGLPYRDVDNNVVLGPTIPHYSIPGDTLYGVGSPSMTVFWFNPTVWNGSHWVDPTAPEIHAGSGAYMTAGEACPYTATWTHLGPNGVYSVVSGDLNYVAAENFVMFNSGLNDLWLEDAGQWTYTLTLTQGNDTITSTRDFDLKIVPEPSSIIALLGGLGSLLAFRRRRA